MFRIAGTFAATLVTAAALLLAAPSARSAPVTWTVDGSVSYVNLYLTNNDYLVSGPGGPGCPGCPAAVPASGSGSGSLSGIQKGNLIPNVSTSLTQVGSAINVSNITISPTTFVGGVSGTATNLVLALNGASRSIGAGGVVSMTNMSLLLTSGVLNLTGPIPATENLSLFFPPIDLFFIGGTSTLTNLGGGNFRWDIVINQGLGFPAGTLFPFNSSLSLDGFLRLGISVPEPGAGLLLGLGLLSVAGLRGRSRAGH
jgi:hypothetical protein